MLTGTLYCNRQHGQTLKDARLVKLVSKTSRQPWFRVVWIIGNTVQDKIGGRCSVRSAKSNHYQSE